MWQPTSTTRPPVTSGRACVSFDPLLALSKHSNMRELGGILPTGKLSCAIEDQLCL